MHVSPGSTSPQPPAVSGPPAAPAQGWAALGASAAIIVAMVAAMRLEGRRWWCQCGEVRLWSWDVWTPHCSQHLIDPYSITHLSHGLIFYMVLAWATPQWTRSWRLCTAIGIAAAWEVLENSPIIIDRYRSATMSLDYLGDSVVNSLGDVLSCIAGFFLAQALGWKKTLALLVAIELLLLVVIRDNLTLNVLMLVYPVDAIKAWQSVGHV
ncbi:MAG: DUF2585 family protein [Phycisphaeraceae bacterium]|nr:DUF2585 family protein [Phycisphaeraceae bacterium]